MHHERVRVDEAFEHFPSIQEATEQVALFSARVLCVNLKIKIC